VNAPQCYVIRSGVSRVRIPQGEGILFFSKMSSLVQGPIHPFLGTVPGVVFREKGGRGVKADHWRPLVLRVRMSEAINPLCMYRESFTLPLCKKLNSLAVKVSPLLQCLQQVFLQTEWRAICGISCGVQYVLVLFGAQGQCDLRFLFVCFEQKSFKNSVLWSMWGVLQGQWSRRIGRNHVVQMSGWRNRAVYVQGGSNMTGTKCDLFTHK
jgi:hypothetical protein